MHPRAMTCAHAQTCSSVCMIPTGLLVGIGGLLLRSILSSTFAAANIALKAEGANMYWAAEVLVPLLKCLSNPCFMIEYSASVSFTAGQKPSQPWGTKSRLVHVLKRFTNHPTPGFSITVLCLSSFSRSAVVYGSSTMNLNQTFNATDLKVAASPASASV